MKKAFAKTIIWIALLWVILGIDILIPIQLCNFGILPHSKEGLLGILFSPFLHANVYHLASNTLPLFILLATLIHFYPKHILGLMATSILLTGILVWTFGRASYHVGASGIIYSIASFLVFAGIYSKQFKLILISLAVIILYGGMIWGIFPGQVQVSWEAHLFGAISGALYAQKIIQR